MSIDPFSLDTVFPLFLKNKTKKFFISLSPSHMCTFATKCEMVKKVSRLLKV